MNNFGNQIYTLFGLTIFSVVLIWGIFRYKLFEGKLAFVQILVALGAILVGAQIFFVKILTPEIFSVSWLFLFMIIGYAFLLANKEIGKKGEQLNRALRDLTNANRKLGQLDRAKTEFISMVSHQLRTPVTIIKGYTSMLIEGDYGALTAEQKGVVKKTRESNERMSTLIEDLLTVSKIESGKLDYTFAKFKIEQICQEVVKEFLPKAKEHKLYLEYKHPKEALPELLIDGEKVREVLNNLVDNAVKYTPRGGVTLTLELCAKAEANCIAGPHIRITVSDTGIGIPEGEMAYLFQKFSRGKNVHRFNAIGTGLGLFVGKEVIKGNGGKIWVESKGENKGARFMVELPLGEKK